MLIDGMTSDYYAQGRPMWAIDGVYSPAGSGWHGLNVAPGGGNDTEIKGLAIVNWPGAGVYVINHNFRLRSSYVGVGLYDVASPNGIGVDLVAGSGGVIGGAGVGEGNVISGNTQSGIRLDNGYPGTDYNLIGSAHWY